MKKFIMTLTVLVSIFLPVLLFANNEQSIVKVEVPIFDSDSNAVKQGVGFFVDKSHVLASKHIVLQPDRNPSKPIVIVLDGKRYNATLIAFDDKEDLALLFTSKPIGEPLRVRDDLVNGDSIVMNSFDQDSNIVGSVGKVTKLYVVEYFMGNFRSSIKSNQGSSGSPCFKDGEVVGVVYAYSRRLKESLHVGAYKINMFIHKYINNFQ